MRLTGLFILLTLAFTLQAQKNLSSEEKEGLELIVRKYFKTYDFEKKQDLLKQISQYDPITESDAKWLVKYTLKAMRIGPKLKETGKGVTSAEDIYKLYTGLLPIDGSNGPNREGVYYTVGGKSKGKKQPLLIGLHGGGLNQGDGGTAQAKWSGASGKGALCIFPTVTNKTAVAWNFPREELFVLDLIERAKRTFNIDTNRIYVVGHSMGGFGTWSLGGTHADLFAALSANAGGVPINKEEEWVEKGIVANIFDTPIFYFHSVDDKQVPWDRLIVVDKYLKNLEKEYSKWKLYNHKFQAYTNIGHGFPGDWNTQRILGWVMKHKRKPYPKYVIWEPKRVYKQVFYNLFLKSPADYYNEKTGPRIVEEIKNKSLIEISYEYTILNLSVLLHPKQINFKKPLVIKKNGEKVFEGVPEYSAWAILASLGQNRDPNQYYMGRVKIKD